MTPGRQQKSQLLTPVVVLVEDDPHHAELMRPSLAKAALTTEMTYISDAQMALNYLLGDEQPETLPKLILLCLNLSKVDGWQVLDKQKTQIRPSTSGHSGLLLVLLEPIGPRPHLAS